jgi:2-amino-4-hydroxy-6-hydroxymethyldihydropteridine diphosphokinase
MDVSPPEHGRLLVAVGMGSNLAPVAVTPFDLEPPSDPRARALEGALVLLRQSGHVLRAASPLYETEPEDAAAGQDAYLNACVLLDAPDDLEGLLIACEAIERQAGRTNKGSGAPRPLDLDLLAAWRAGEAGELRPLPPRETPVLTVPHPRLAARAFVLVPLAGVMPDTPLLLAAGAGEFTAWQLLRKLARGARGVKPGPASASFPFRGYGSRGDQIEFC